MGPERDQSFGRGDRNTPDPHAISGIYGYLVAVSIFGYKPHVWATWLLSTPRALLAWLLPVYPMRLDSG